MVTKLLVFVAAAGVAVAAIAIAVAAIPGSDGVIHGCYGPGNDFRVIDKDNGETCRQNEKPLDFNQTGPKGDTGDRGPPGISGYESVTRDVTLSAPSHGLTSVGCPTGKKVISGGMSPPDGHPELQLTGSFPSTSGSGWDITWDLSGTTPLAVELIAVCAVVN